MASVAQRLSARVHIQNFTDTSNVEHHWGYADRVIPCTNDPGSCAYLDLVYNAHDLGIVYTGIIWATIGGILIIWAIGRRLWPVAQSDAIWLQDERAGLIGQRNGGLVRVGKSIASVTRRYLLPDALRAVFGRVTRLQVLILTILAGYLLIWSFVGMTYQMWWTPVKNSTLHNTRTTLGPWADRVGVLAYALTPFSILLSSRESLLSVLTGVPYQDFLFLHRWLGYIITIQGVLHTIGWCIVEGVLYQPQPYTALSLFAETYIIYGFVAIVLVLLIFVLSTPWGIRLTGYEFFRKSHYVLAMIYIGGCYGHWAQLSCYLLPALALWFIDRGMRLARTALIHHQYLPDGSIGFMAARAEMSLFPDTENGDVVRLDLSHPLEPWKVGQHYYLCFTECNVWQSHPMTPLSAPVVQDGLVKQSYVLRARKGETRNLARLAARKISEKLEPTTGVVLTGAYGESVLDGMARTTNVLAIAGGTGITYVLPVLLRLARQPVVEDRSISLIWIVRHTADVRWVAAELNALQQARKHHNIHIHVYVTREPEQVGPEKQKDSESSSSVSKLPATSSNSEPDAVECDVEMTRTSGDSQDRHPDLKAIVRDFVDTTVRGSTSVFASGPGGMLSDLRTVIAACNSGAGVWKGEERFDVSLTCDNRLEW